MQSTNHVGGKRQQPIENHEMRNNMSYINHQPLN